MPETPVVPAAIPAPVPCPNCGASVVPVPPPLPAPVASKPNIFQQVGSFFSNTVWNGAIKPAATWFWHIAGGAILGAVTPSLTNVATQALTGKPVDLHTALASTTSTLVALGVGALFGLAQHSNNQEVKTLAGTVTPDMQAQLDAKISTAVTTAITNAVKK